MTKYYLCTGGNVTGLCEEEGCYLNGGECEHTMFECQARNPKDRRNFVKMENGDLWEVGEIVHEEE